MPEETVQTPPPTSSLEINDDLLHVRTFLTAKIQALQASPEKSRERSLLITKLEEANFWAGQGAFASDTR
jgi:hypothetical protein